MSRDIEYFSEKLNPIITELNAVSDEWESLYRHINTVVSTLKNGFVSETQMAFEGVHDFKQKDYKLLSNLLQEMPRTIKTSLNGMLQEDGEIARRIRSHYTL
jgi:uncharacterized protein YukE